MDSDYLFANLPLHPYCVPRPWLAAEERRIITGGNRENRLEHRRNPELPERIAEAAVRRGRVCLHPFDGRDCRQRVGGGHGHVRRAGRQDRNPVIHRQEYP